MTRGTARQSVTAASLLQAVAALLIVLVWVPAVRAADDEATQSGVAQSGVAQAGCGRAGRRPMRQFRRAPPTSCSARRAPGWACAARC